MLGHVVVDDLDAFLALSRAVDNGLTFGALKVTDQRTAWLSAVVGVLVGLIGVGRHRGD